MTDPGDTGCREEDREIEPAKPGPGVETAFVRLTFWQTVLSVVGVIIATIALYAALTESAAVRQQTAAAVWPFLQLQIEDFDSESDAHFDMSLRNVGVGPARVRAFRLQIDGQSVLDWEQAASALGHELSADVSRNFIANRVLSPGESVSLINVRDAEFARDVQAAVANPTSAVVFCYCSIFDDCWLADSRGDLQAPETVSACPDFGAAAFRN